MDAANGIFVTFAIFVVVVAMDGDGFSLIFIAILSIDLLIDLADVFFGALSQFRCMSFIKLAIVTTGAASSCFDNNLERFFDVRCDEDEDEDDDDDENDDNDEQEVAGDDEAYFNAEDDGSLLSNVIDTDSLLFTYFFDITIGSNVKRSNCELVLVIFSSRAFNVFCTDLLLVLMVPLLLPVPPLLVVDETLRHSKLTL